MNKFIGMGRITAPLELKTTQSGIPVLSFTIAIDRGYTNKETGERLTDFPNIVAYRGTAEFISKWFGKGRLIAIEGQVQTRTYEAQDGTKRYVTEIVAEKAFFTGEKKDDADTVPEFDTDGFADMIPDEDDDLPF